MELKLDDARQQLFELLLAEEGVSAVTAVPPIPRARPGGELPLSFAQQRLWLLDQLEPGTPLYNLTGWVRIHGRLQLGALRRSLDEVVARHEALRTTFTRGPGGPAQLVQPPAPLELPVVDCSHRPAEATRLAAEESQRGFELGRGPLLRARLLRLATEEHLLVLTLHHIAADGWSVGVLVSELSSHYLAFASSRAPALPAPRIQYADFARWQRSWLEGARLDEQLAYWTAKLQGAPRSIDLPTDRPRPPAQTFAGDTVQLRVPAELTAALRSLSREQGATLFMTLFAAFNVLLFRYSGQADLVVGTTVANRDRRELEGLIGLFVNTLALRTRLDGNPTFLAVLDQVRRTALEAYAHQDAPFEQVVSAVQPERDLGRNPLFQVMFDLVTAPGSRFELPGLRLSLEQPSTGTAKFDLSLAVEDRGDALSVELEYSSHLFDRGTITRLGGHYLRLLQSVVEDPSQSVERLELLTEDERRQQLAWNDTARAWPQLAPFHRLFEAQVARTPDAVAASEGGRAVTYRELNERANRLARALRGAGVRADSLVGVLHDRGTDYLAALLGIWKSGGAYLALDPAVPAARLARVCAESRCQWILTERQYLEAATELCPRGATLLQALLQNGGPSEDPDWLGTLEDLAYVLFTSGSTGTPKGAMVTHAGMTNHALGMAEVLGLGAADCMAQTARQSFDVSVWQFIAPLAVGGRVAILSDDCGRDPRALLAELTEQRVSVCELVPTQLGMLLDELERAPGSGSGCGEPSSLRWMISTGEPLSAELCARWFRRVSRTPMANAYGPAECADDVTCCLLLGPPAERRPGGMPIHGTLPNCQVHVLDAQLGLVPLGVPGELCIGGVCVGRGYLGDPARTAERFLRDPFSEDPGARLYRTGDRARRLADGTIEFLGRTDHQVKIRGVRIEIGEIESTLASHPQVSEALVVARGELGEAKQLVAYVVGRAGEPPPARQLRSHLRQRLPPQMVPSAFVALEALPQLPNGKIDRHSLPPPSTELREATYVAPSSALEQHLAALWARVLGAERVGIHDDFFELGGHSLLATQVIARVREAYGQELPLRAFFEDPTIAGLAARLAVSSEPPPADPKLARRERPEQVPVSLTQERMWLIHQREPGLSAYNIPVAVSLKGALDTAALQRSLEEIVRRHEALRTTFPAVDGEPVQVIHPDASFPLPRIDLTALPAEVRPARARALAVEDSGRPFDLQRGPLFRGALVQLSEREHVLLLNVHHIVSDGWSMGVLLGELKALYAAFAAGSASPLAELPVQYADYTLWQREQLRGARLEAPLGYWRQQLAGPLPALALPTDHPRPAHSAFQGASIPFGLPPALTHGLEELARAEGATLFMTLLAAFKLQLHLLTGQTDLVVGTPIANRDRPELERLIGLFVNTLALRTRLQPSGSFRELLARVKQSALEAFARPDVPFKLIVETVRPEPDPGRHPIFQAMFVLQNVPTPPLEQHGLSLEELELSHRSAKFDLLLNLEEGPRGLTGTLDYRTDLFEEATARRWAAQLRALLEQLVQSPGRPLRDFQIH